MKQSELIELLGLPSTDSKMIQFFEKYNLGKLPSIITSNQVKKSIICKSWNLSFWFSYDITNERFQPPISPKKDNYKFIAFLSSIMFTHVDNSEKKPDPKKPEFWDVTPAPNKPLEVMKDFFGAVNYEIDAEVGFEKWIGADMVLKAQYTVDKKGKYSTTVWSVIKEESEIISRVFFEGYSQETFSCKAQTAIIRWLFNKEYLKLSKEVYQSRLKADTAAILAFVQRDLKGHLWANQLADVHRLRRFLYRVTNNSKVTDENGNRISFYIENLILESMGRKEEFDKLYEEDYGKVGDFLNQLPFDSDFYENIDVVLTTAFERYKKIPETVFN